MLKRLLLLAALLAGLASGATAQTKERLQGWCERGAQTVTTDGRQSTTKVQRSYPQCTVTVYVQGTLTLASLYSDYAGTPTSNPFTASTIGQWSFIADSGRYDVVTTGGGMSSPTTYPGMWISAGGGGGGPCPAGSDKQVQYNNAGNCAGAVGFEYQLAVSPNVSITGQGIGLTPLYVTTATGVTGVAAIDTDTSSTVTATAAPGIVISTNSTGTPGTGFGARLAYKLEASTTPDLDAAGVDAIWTDATIGTRSSALVFNTVKAAGALTEVARLRIAGSTSDSELWLGNGETAGTPVAGALRATGGSGSNIAGGALKIAGGIGTGSGAGGAIQLYTAPAGASSSTPNTSTLRFYVDQKGNIVNGGVSLVLASTATDAFPFFPYTDTIPSGVPSLGSGALVVESDTVGGRYHLWGYFNSAWRDLTGSAVPGGPTNAVQTNSGASTFAGASGFLFDSSTNTASLGDGGSLSGKFRFYNASNANYTLLQSGAPGSNISLTLPSILPGGADECLQISSAGVISATGAPCGGGGGGTCPAGSQKQVQYYNAGNCGGAVGFEYQQAASPNVSITAQNAAYTALAVFAAASPSVSVFTVRADISGSDFEILSTGRPTTSNHRNAGLQTERFGAGSTASGDNTAAFGYNATATGTSSTAYGSGATASANYTIGIGHGGAATAQYATAIGYSATAAAVDSIAIGPSANPQVTATGSIAIGSQARVTGSRSIMFHTAGFISQLSGSSTIAFNIDSADTVSQSNHFIAGDDDNPITDVYFGKGVYADTAGNYTIHGTNASGENVAGFTINLAGSQSTGSGAAGVVNMQISRPGTGGGITANNVLSTVFTFDGDADESKAYQTALRGATTLIGTISENLSLSTGGATTDTSIQLPADAIILSVSVRITTTIAGVDSTTFSAGDAGTSGRFGSTGTLTAGTTFVGLNQMQGGISTDATGPVQTSAAAVRLTLSGGADNTPSAGAVTVTIHYIKITPPTS